MKTKKNKIEIIADEGGYFLNLIFDGENAPTLFFIAELDFESLLTMADDSEKDWQKLRDELFLLLRHTGHNKKHELGEKTVKKIREVLKSHASTESVANADG